jgi:hypothetical protein
MLVGPVNWDCSPELHPFSQFLKTTSFFKIGSISINPLFQSSCTYVGCGMIRSRSHVTTDGWSARMSRCRAYSGTCDQILLSVRMLLFESCCHIFVGYLLWREVGSVICLSQPSNLPVFTSSIYVTCVLQFSNLYTIYIKLHSVPSEYSRLCRTSDY